MKNLNEKSKVEIANHSLFHLSRFMIVIIIILSIIGCDILYSLFHRLNFPNPSDFPHHDHEITFQVRSINHSQDSIGVEKAKFCLPFYIYSRESIDSIRLYHFFLLDFPKDLYIEIPPTDTEIYYYNAEVTHYIGYQQEYGGDTSRLSCLDSIGEWNMTIKFDIKELILISGDSISGVGHSKIIPDTIKDSSAINIEILFDLNGLFSIDTPTGNAYVNKSKISCRQM